MVPRKVAGNNRRAVAAWVGRACNSAAHVCFGSWLSENVSAEEPTNGDQRASAELGSPFAASGCAVDGRDARRHGGDYRHCVLLVSSARVLLLENPGLPGNRA